MANAKTEEAAVEAASTEVDTRSGEGIEQFAVQPPVVAGADNGWRSWVAQQGGLLPPNTPPTVFPGVSPIYDYINPNLSYPSYYPNNASGATPYAPMNANAVDPFAGWTAQKEKTGTIRPSVPGITS